MSVEKISQVARKTCSKTIGKGPLHLVVKSARDVTPKIRVITLEAKLGGTLPEVTAGAHLILPVILADGSHGKRRYSIASSPLGKTHYEIAVLREDAGGGGSISMHSDYEVGVEVYTQSPKNFFPLIFDAARFVLVAGGIGITPIIAMAYELSSRGAKFEIHYAGKCPTEMAYIDLLREKFLSETTFYFSKSGGRMDISAIIDTIDDAARVYACGPNSMIGTVIDESERRGIRNRVCIEDFNNGVKPNDREFEVELSRSGKVVKVGANQSILEAVNASGGKLNFGCTMGMCRGCAVKVLEGTPEHRDCALSQYERGDEKLFCPCVSRAMSERLVIDA